MRKIPTLHALALAVLAGCVDQEPLSPDRRAFSVAEAVVPPTVAVTAAGQQLTFWPYTSATIGGPESDPINVVFANSDARGVRAALLSLDGNRTAFGMPNTPPFNCTWKDAVGGAQVSYADAEGWTGSAVQLECGDYAPMRFHVRLFPAGSATLGNVHFEVIVPGTNQHAVLSWELAEKLLTADLARSGLLAGVTQTQSINPAPTFQGIIPQIYNGLPPALRFLIGGPAGNVSTPVGIQTDGRATVITLSATPQQQPGLVQREFAIPFDQIIPKPFCSTGPLDYLRVQGTVNVKQTINATPSGNYMSMYHASGSLDLTPINPLTGEVGETFRAQVNDIYRNLITDQVTQTSNLSLQVMIGQPFNGVLHASLHVGPGESSVSSVDVKCN
jgi:hypothetical protein